MCDYYDDLEALKGFGAANKESLAELVWAFFEYWAWKHDYNNAVISVRTGGFLTKSQKEWTRRVGNERHLVCIEVPFFYASRYTHEQMIFLQWWMHGDVPVSRPRAGGPLALPVLQSTLTAWQQPSWCIVNGRCARLNWLPYLQSTTKQG